VELSDFLSIGTEENLSNFAVDQFVPALATCLNMEHNAEIMLLSCRALAYIMEALPSSVGSVVSHHLVPILCAKLLNIEYIDLAEQALQCLEKISYEHPAAIVREGGLMAVLTFFDFFATGTQRVALSIAANICRQIPSDCYSMITDAFPILTNLLQYPDQKSECMS
jgi:E3 ubiquitin-protein ligase TRIP12